LERGHDGGHFILDAEQEDRALREQLRGAVFLTDEEVHCLICAMAGNFPDRFKPIRMDLLRKLSKAQHARGGQ
jgi:hypothetical protein